jgi:hypothetical protein
MTTDQELRRVAEGIEGAVPVHGTGQFANSVARRVTDSEYAVPAVEHGEWTDETDGARAVVVVVNTAGPQLWQAADGDNLVIAVLDVPDEGIDQSLLSDVRATADVLLLAGETAIETAFEFVEMTREPGDVNIDLADAKTVLTTGRLATLSHGQAVRSDGDGTAVVDRALEGFPTGVRARRAAAVLVRVVGDSRTHRP